MQCIIFIMHRYFLLTCCLTISTIMVAQTAWLRNPNELYLSASQQFMRSNKYYTIDGNLVNTTPYYSGISSVYAEYGINKYLTAIATIPALKFQGYTSTNTVFGLGDVSLAAKLGFWQATIPVAYTFEVEFPTGNAELVAFNTENPSDFISLPSGDGEINFHNKLAISKSFYPHPFYAGVLIDYNARTNYQNINFDDQWITAIEFGYQMGRNNWLIFKANTVSPLGESTQLTAFSRGVGTAFSFYQLEYNTNVSKSISVNAKLGIFSDFPVNRNNVYSAPVVSLGLAYKGLPFHKE